jgi:hypothetical protein
MGRIGPALLLAALLTAELCSTARAQDTNPNNCNGVDWDEERALAVSKVIAKPRVNFVKSPYDDDFKAASCPADTEACRRKAYVVTGDLVLTGVTRNSFTCVSFQSPLATKQTWTTGWLPSAALAPVAPMPNPSMQDWLGTWYHPGGPVTITRGDGDKLHVVGGITVPTARDFHTGEFDATVTPGTDTIAFADDGTIAFSDPSAGCRVRMQRIGPWLMIEDNGGCGGAAVSFTGFYRRKK